jgi:hypothetical protein
VQSRTKLQERRRPSDLLEVVRLNGRAFQFLYKDEGFGSDMSLPQTKDHWLQVRIMHEQGSMAHFLPACLLAMCCAEFMSCRAVCLPLQGCTQVLWPLLKRAEHIRKSSCFQVNMRVEKSRNIHKKSLMGV